MTRGFRGCFSTWGILVACGISPASVLSIRRASFPAACQTLGEAAPSRVDQARDVVVRWRDVPLSRAYDGVRLGALPASPGGRERHVALLEGEIDLYPRALVRRMGLLSVDLVERLVLDGERLGGLYDPGTWTVFFDASLFDRWDAYGRRALHHELFHSLDAWSSRGIAGEREWGDLNETGFRYTPFDRSLHWDTTAILPYRGRRGFLTRYAMSSGVEDRAEVFSFLMAHPEVLEERTREDPVLWRKAEVLRRFLRGLCEEVDERYWSDLKRGRAGASKPTPWRDVPSVRSVRTASREAIPDRAGRDLSRGRGDRSWRGATRAGAA